MVDRTGLCTTLGPRGLTAVTAQSMSSSRNQHELRAKLQATPTIKPLTTPLTTLKCIGMWNMERGIPHSNSRSRISECGTWNCPFENISPLTMLKCIGMWNMECSQIPNPDSKGLECGMWNCLFENVSPLTMLKRIECEMWNVAKIPNPNSKGLHLECGMWNCLFENVSLLTMLKCIGMWNVEFHIMIESFQFPFQNFGIWNLEFGMWQFGNPHSTFHIPKFWNWNVDCGFPHSKFHIPMHFSMVRSKTFRRRHFKFQIAKFWNWNWDLEFGHIPHSSALQHGEGWDVPTKTIPNFKLQILGIGIWNCLLHSKFHSIPIPLWLSQTYLQCCSIQVPFQFHNGWNGMWNLGLILGVAWSFSLHELWVLILLIAHVHSAAAKSVQNRFCPIRV